MSRCFAPADIVVVYVKVNEFGGCGFVLLEGVQCNVGR